MRKVRNESSIDGMLMREVIRKTNDRLILTNKRQIFTNVSSLPNVSLDSDHRIVMGIMTRKERKKPKKITRERYRAEKLKDGEIGERFDEAMR